MSLQHRASNRTPSLRFLVICGSIVCLVASSCNVPKAVTNEGIKAAFAPYGASKGIWTGHLQSLGIVILAFHDLRHAENACRAVRSGKAHIVLGGVLRAIQLHSGFISVAEARDLTGNPSPVTEIEEEAAFLIQIKDHSTQPSTVRSILDRFGTLLAFREWHPRTGDGQVMVLCGILRRPRDASSISGPTRQAACLGHPIHPLHHQTVATITSPRPCTPHTDSSTWSQSEKRHSFSEY
ncbi:hypothetical protein H4582DRAFT_1308486 [Lactarius indigo]|nr:hypothetical protein H4582DRAFT_1308486 [Lactarius indigo]